jgi:hypothetical protein
MLEDIIVIIKRIEEVYKDISKGLEKARDIIKA